MIRDDGIRSKARKWFANRQLQIIKDVDVPAKTVVLDGFFINVWRQGELSGGSVVAPMGAVVVCSHDDGITSCASEFWLSAFTSSASRYLKDADVSEGYARERFIRTGEADSSLWVPPGYADVTNCRPVLCPYKGSEYFVFVVSVRRGYNSILCEALLDIFAGDGSQLARKSYSLEADSAPLSAQICQTVPSTSFTLIRHQGGSPFSAQIVSSEYDYQDLILASIADFNAVSDASIRYFLAPDVWADLPVNLFNALAPNIDYPTITSSLFGSYGYAKKIDGPITLFGVVTSMLLPGELDDWFYDDAGVERADRREWWLFYTIYTEPYADETGALIPAEVYTVTSANMLETLDTLANNIIISYPVGVTEFDITNGDITIDWDNAAAMLAQLVAYPNVMHETPHDSIMFHAEDGLYTWTRSYGAVKFGQASLDEVTMDIPSEVTSTEGVRPNITYSGDSLYLCVCESVNDKVEAIYLGSPFEILTAPEGAEEFTTNWRAVAMPTTVSNEVTDTLLHVRPVFVSFTRIVLLGVIERYIDATTKAYSLGVLDTDTSRDWRVFGDVPIGTPKNGMWDVSFYGKGEYSKLMREYLSPPAATPQTAYKTYADYTVVGQ